MANINQLTAEGHKAFKSKGVVGVGYTQAPETDLLFLLERDGPGLREEIAAWAAKQGVHAEFLVIGQIQPLSAST